MHDVTIRNNIFLAFHSHFAGGFYGSFRAECHIIVILDDLSADKSFFKVCMNHSGAFGHRDKQDAALIADVEAAMQKCSYIL